MARRAGAKVPRLRAEDLRLYRRRRSCSHPGRMETPARALSWAECLDHLRNATVGRVGVTHRALPAIVPVNYALPGGKVVFRTEPEGMLASACASSVVAFEVDDVAPDGRSGWSVLAVGVAELLDGSAAVRAAETGLVT